MPGAVGDKFDFFLSRRGSVAAVAQEVADVLTTGSFVQDYDIPLGASFVEATHEAVKNSRDLIILFTKDYEQSSYTRKEFTSFEAERLRDERDATSSSCVATMRRSGAFWPMSSIRTLSVSLSPRSAHAVLSPRRSVVRRLSRRGRTFVGVPPRTAGFTGSADELDRLDAILIQERPAAVTQVGRGGGAGHGRGRKDGARRRIRQPLPQPL